MDDRLNIIITGEEGRTRSFAFRRPLVKKILGCSAALMIILVALSISGVSLSFRTAELKGRVVDLEDSIIRSGKVNQHLESQVSTLEQEKDALLKDAVGKLNEKSQLIETILSAVGVDVEIQESRQNSGGLFASTPGETHEDLIFRAERYLNTIKNVPLGPPVPGVITSKFGRRVDPINQQRAYHDGVDIRGKIGTEVMATADGRVFEQGYDQGLGHYVIIDHKDGFRTLFAHMKKRAVKAGQRVSRGDLIGLLGNSGRSTGPHVHYEIHYRGKLVNPVRFMRIASYIPNEKAPTIERQYKSAHR